MVCRSTKGFAHKRRVSAHRVARQWGGEACRLFIKSTHTENTFLACATAFHIWDITRAKKSTLGQSDFCPFESQGLSHFLTSVKRCKLKWYGTSRDHLDWSRLPYREQFKEGDEEADRGNDGKITSKSGMALNGVSYYGKPRSARTGGSWL